MTGAVRMRSFAGLAGWAGRAALAATIALLAGCAGSDGPAQRVPGKSPVTPMAATIPAAARCSSKEQRAALDAFVAKRRDAYVASIAKARGFLDGLEVDPIALRAVRIKGKKKLTEALDSYYRLWQVAPPDARAAIKKRVEALAVPTREDRYHDLLLVPDPVLKEDATSYLRAAVLLDRMGVDIKRYREEISNAKWRLDAQMKDRGPHQRRAFHTYYKHFGLTEPFELQGALGHGLIAGRADPDKLSRLDVYAVTHEVYAAYDFGEALDADPFSQGDLDYLSVALPKLMTVWLDKKDPDLVAELIACQRYVRMTGDPTYARGLEYLLTSQNPDGSWGSYEAMRARLGEYVKQGFYLHSTMVAIEALTLGFEEMFRKGEGPVCG